MYEILTLQVNWIRAMLEVIAPVLKLPLQTGSIPSDQVCKARVTHSLQLTGPEYELVTLVRSVNAGENLDEAVRLFLSSMSFCGLTLRDILSAVTKSQPLFDALHAAWIGIEVSGLI